MFRSSLVGTSMFSFDNKFGVVIRPFKISKGAVHKICPLLGGLICIANKRIVHISLFFDVKVHQYWLTYICWRIWGRAVVSIPSHSSYQDILLVWIGSYLHDLHSLMETKRQMHIQGMTRSQYIHFSLLTLSISIRILLINPSIGYALAIMLSMCRLKHKFSVKIICRSRISVTLFRVISSIVYSDSVT